MRVFRFTQVTARADNAIAPNCNLRETGVARPGILVVRAPNPM